MTDIAINPRTPILFGEVVAEAATTKGTRLILYIPEANQLVDRLFWSLVFCEANL